MLDERMSHADEQQLYLRAEPSDDSREELLRHRRHLHAALEPFRCRPRLAERSDLHYTVLFLHAARVWERVFHLLGVEVRFSADDLQALVAIPPEERRLPDASPHAYEPFFRSANAAVFVLRITMSPPSLTDALIRHAEDTLRSWERDRRFPQGTVAALLSHPLYPLARDRDAFRAHITLGRGTMERAQQTLVADEVRALPLASEIPVSFTHIDLRAVRSSRVILPFSARA